MGDRAGVEAHQPTGHSGGGEAGDSHAVPVAVAIHHLLEATVDFISEHDRGKHLTAGGAGKFSRSDRNRDVIARMAADLTGFCVDVIIEVKNSNKTAIDQHRV